MKIGTFTLFLFVSIFSFSQRIEYRTSQSLRDSIVKYLDFEKNVYGCCWREEGGLITTVFFTLAPDDSLLSEICALSNRVLYVSDKVCIPIIFDSDFYLSTISNHLNDGVVTTKSIGVLGGLVCQFEPYFESGKVLKVFYDQ